MMNYNTLIKYCEANTYIRRSMRSGAIGLREVNGEWVFSIVLISNCKQNLNKGWSTVWQLTDELCKRTHMVSASGDEYPQYRVAIRYVNIMLDITWDELLVVADMYHKDNRVNMRSVFTDWPKHNVRVCSEILTRDTRNTISEVREVSRAQHAQSLLRAAGF